MIAPFGKLRASVMGESKRPIEAQQHLERAGNVVRLVAEVDSQSANADAEANALQPGRGRAGLGPDTAGVEETDRRQPAAPPDLVFEVERG